MEGRRRSAGEQLVRQGRWSKEGALFWSRFLRLLRVRTITGGLIGSFGLLAFSGGVASLPAMASTEPSTPTVRTTEGGAFSTAPAWLNAAIPYVHVKNFVATVDPRIGRALRPADVATVRADVARYNATPMSTRTIGVTHSVTISIQRPASAAYSACYGYLAVHSWNWWGVQFYANSCFAEDLAFGVGLFAVASGLLLLVPGLDVAVAALMFMLGMASGSIFWADHHCGMNGVYLNVPWVPAAVWASSIC